MQRKAKQNDYMKTALRLPRDLHARLHDAAEANNRTYNSEILQRLEESFLLRSSSSTIDIRKDIALIEGVLGDLREKLDSVSTDKQ